MKSIKLSKYFQLCKPKYKVLRVIPDTSIDRNYNSSNIARTVNYMYRSYNIMWKNFWKFIKRDVAAWNIEVPPKLGFFIDIKHNNVHFYFIVPELYESLFKEKITEIWKKVTVKEVERVDPFSDEALKYYLTYKKEDGLSLKVNKSSNQPLSNILNVLDIMQEGDRVGIFTNLMPTSQNNWKTKYENTINRLKNNQTMDKHISTEYIFKFLATIIGEVVEGIFEAVNELLGKKDKFKIQSELETAITSLIITDKKELSNSTKNKKDAIVVNTQIVVQSDSKDTLRKENNIVSVMEAYKTLNEDNQLLYKKLKSKKVDYDTFKVDGAKINTMSVEECQNLIELPGRTLLEQHKCIEKIDVLESPIPEELREGVMCIGESIYKGHKQRAYLSTDKDLQNLTLVLIGPTRSGKTTLISNLSKDSVDNDECTILFDFCGNCELSEDVSSVFPSEKVLNIDCSDGKTLQGLGYNEVKNEDDDVFKVYRNAKIQTSQLLTLINSINEDNKVLPPKMERYLQSAALVVFINSGSIKDVFGVLQNHKVRLDYISKVPKNQQDNLEEYILSLNELNEYEKNSENVIGTKINAISGIIDRINKLKNNVYMELMLKKNCENNIDLLEEIQKSQLICLKMPEIMFSTETEKDIYCTYWITKLWLALQIRKWKLPKEKDRVKVNIIVDELYQVPYTQEFIRKKLSQMAKFSGKMIISAHYLGQIPIIRNELKAANSSYMLISGADQDNYKELKDMLYPYTLEDLLALKRYHSLNLIKYNGGYAKFTTALPKPIGK